MGKILIVDDDKNIRELLHILLQEQGYEVVEAKNGIEALAKVAQSATDLAIVDVMMPEMDGFELSKHLRHYYENMPILMLVLNLPFLLPGYLIKAVFFHLRGFGKSWRQGTREAFACMRKIQKPKFRLKNLPNYVWVQCSMCAGTVRFIDYRIRRLFQK